MIRSYSKKECTQILNKLISQNRLSQIEYDLLLTEADNSAEAFCEELILIYQDRVRLYLNHTATQLSALSDMPIEVAEEISIGYAYGVFAKINFYTSPFALLGIFQGGIHLALKQNSDDAHLLNFMESLHATLGVSLGICSIAPYLWRCGIVENEDPAINSLKAMNKTVFIHLISLWQLYQDIDFVKLNRIAHTLKYNLISQAFLDAVSAYDRLAKRMSEHKSLPIDVWLKVVFTNDDTFILLKQSLFDISNYIQYDLLENEFNNCFQQLNLSNPLHQQISQIYTYKTINMHYDLHNTTHRVALMQEIFFSQSITKELFINLYPELCKQLYHTFNTFEDLYGEIIRPKLRLIDRTISTIFSPSIDQIIHTKSNSFFEKKRLYINNMYREQNDKFSKFESELQERIDHLMSAEATSHEHYQQALMHLETCILENRNRLTQKEVEISQHESEMIQNIESDSSLLNRSIAECKERIRTHCRNRFFAGVNGTTVTTSSGNFDFVLNRISL